MELDARLRGVDDAVPFIPDERTLARIELLTLETSAGCLDVQRRTPGVASYGRLRRNAERVDLDGFSVLVASPDDLIAMKRAAGREQDLMDISALEAIKRLRARSVSSEPAPRAASRGRTRARPRASRGRPAPR